MDTNSLWYGDKSISFGFRSAIEDQQGPAQSFVEEYGELQSSKYDTWEIMKSN